MIRALSIAAVLLCSSLAAAQQPACRPGMPCWQGGTVVSVTPLASTSATCSTCTTGQTQAVRTTSATCTAQRRGLFSRLFGRCR